MSDYFTVCLPREDSNSICRNCKCPASGMDGRPCLPGMKHELQYCVCRICGNTALDRTPCLPYRVHELQEPTDAVSKTFDKLVNQFIITPKEKSDMGLLKKTGYTIDLVSKLPTAEYEKAVTTDTIYNQLFSQLFNVSMDTQTAEIGHSEAEESHMRGKNELEKYLKTIEHKEDEYKQMTRKKMIEFRRTHQHASVEERAEFEGKLKAIEHQHFMELASAEFALELRENCVVRDTLEFRKFIDGFTRVILPGVLQISSYCAYLHKLIGSVSLQEMSDAYANFCLSLPEANLPEVFLSVDNALVDFFKRWIVIHLTSTNMKRRGVFLAVVKRYEVSVDASYTDFREHLMHFIYAKLLIKENCGSCITPMIPKTGYMMKVLAQMKLPFNHTLDVSLGSVKLRYIFQKPFPTLSGYRRATGQKGEQRVVYDFLEFYNQMQTSEDIQLVVYKQGDDIRVKKHSVVTEVGELLNDYVDYTAIYFHSHDSSSDSTPPHAIFDHSTTSCYLVGTSDQVKRMLDVFKSMHEDNGSTLDLHDGELLSFEGVMEVTTRALLMKNLLQEFFLVKPILRYFYPRTESANVGNYIFYYTPEEIDVPSELYDYVEFHIENQRRLTTTSNVWSIGFSGTKQDQVLPFLSMLIGLLQMLENIVYDQRFDRYHKAEKEYLAYLRANIRSQENTMSSISQAFISKREVYIMLLREAGLNPSQLANYGNSTRPFPVKIDGNIAKWMTFYASVLTRLNHFLDSESNLDYTVGDPRMETMFPVLSRKLWSVLDEMDYKGCNMTFGSRDIGLSFAGQMFFAYPEKGNVYPMVMVHPRTIDPNYGIQNQAQDELFQQMMIPVRFSRYIGSDLVGFEGKVQTSSQRNHKSTPGIQGIVSLFTDQPADHMTFFRPQRDDEKQFNRFVNEVYRPEVLRALLAQHLWDHSPSEIQETLHTMNVFLHQDMLQNLEDAAIFCFVPTKEGYVYQAPRHNQWYAINTSYTNAMFLFRTKMGNYQVALFTGSSMYTPMTTKMRNFIKSATLRAPIAVDKLVEFGAPIAVDIGAPAAMSGPAESPIPEIVDKSDEYFVSHDNLVEIIRRKVRFTVDGQFIDPIKGIAEAPNEQHISLRLAGQLFDTNGKCVGIRVQTEEEVQVGLHGEKKFLIMDLHINPQSPIMRLHKERKKANIASRLAYVSDVMTNVSEKFGSFDARFTLIKQPKTSVKYPVSVIYERTRKWKQEIYIFCRMVITHWLLFREEVTKFSDVSDLREWNVYSYVTRMILPHEAAPARVTQEIENVIIPEIHKNFDDFIEYLGRIYPNVFYGGRFHVDADKVELMRHYMERELDLIQTYPPSFGTQFVNMRMDTKLLPSSISRASGETNRNTVLHPGELVSARPARAGPLNLKQQEFVGVSRILEDIHITRVKKELLSSEYYMRVEYFNPLMDPLSVVKKTEHVKKAELIMIEFDQKLYFLRLTRVGYYETACYICHMWKTQRHIMSYDEEETLVTSSRLYSLQRGCIEENKDNDEIAIRATGQNYQILNYTRAEATGVDPATMAHQQLFPSLHGQSNKTKESHVYAAMLPLY